MDTLYSWNAKRSGSTMSVTHSCGKISGIDIIQPEGGQIIATATDGRKYILAVVKSL